ncbi:MAG TPA: 16S rRNA (cytosine(1402)-N(4))-methyltransferase RsmH, partial [Thermodesulfovibrionales bacterium]|nr:16S rRNA (cytosine(1402)-N(4))-methyltransferase RsmH [Thermodesulfovibrionales bacterium]
VVEMLNIRSGGTYVDATVGLGGHAEEILRVMGPTGKFVGMDRDDEALKMAGQRLGNDRVVLKKGSFSGLMESIFSLGIREVDGILFDFGVSMMQFKDQERGFSFSTGERLDMRMDRSQKMTADEIVNTYSQVELERIFREYGEEGSARKIAKAIITARTRSRIRTCSELAKIVSAVSGKRGKHHPATRTFQALRIVVNDEIREIDLGLRSSVELLRSGGRLCAISYHSLEDRLVKHLIRDSAREGVLRALTKKPLTPSPEEIRSNPSARSAKMRCAERA